MPNYSVVIPNPTVSKILQEWLFEKGYIWGDGTNFVQHTDSTILSVQTNEIRHNGSKEVPSFQYLRGYTNLVSIEQFLRQVPDHPDKPVPFILNPDVRYFVQVSHPNLQGPIFKLLENKGFAHWESGPPERGVLFFSFGKGRGKNFMRKDSTYDFESGAEWYVDYAKAIQISVEELARCTT